MRLHRFFIDNIIGSQKELVVSDVGLLHQWKKVFRLGAGDSVVLFDGSGNEYECKIETLSKDRADIFVGESRLLHLPKKDVWLCVAVIKKDHFEWVVEKGTELGVNNFIPILADRSEKKDLNIERLNKIAREASEQSGRGSVPKIHSPMTLRDVLSGAIDLPDRKITFEPDGEVFSDKDFNQTESVAIFIGSEGGWSDEELKFFTDKNIDLKSMGKQILRAETAAIASATLFLIL
jgi:16S rRNA (uracil1498-N3)-methyltransferase